MGRKRTIREVAARMVRPIPGTTARHSVPYVWPRLFLLSPQAFEQVFRAWTQSLHQASQGTIVAIDGKTSRGSHDRLHEQNLLHLVSAWASENGVVLAQRSIDEKFNEIKAIPKLLDDLMLKGYIVMIDAMGCQKDIVEKIREREADYVIGLKGNQPRLQEDVQVFFDDARQIEFRDIPHEYCKTAEKGHGRLEIRRYWLCPAATSIPQDHAWRDLNGIGMVEAERHVQDQVTTERRYYICSFDKNVYEFARAVRGHWGIENSLHWVLDMAFREDQLRVRLNHAAENAAVLRHIALNLLKQESTAKCGIAAKQKMCGWDHDYLLKVLSLAAKNV
jgi:predicted transposase YbfD/YdcC